MNERRKLITGMAHLNPFRFYSTPAEYEVLRLEELAAEQKRLNEQYWHWRPIASETREEEVRNENDARQHQERNFSMVVRLFVVGPIQRFYVRVMSSTERASFSLFIKYFLWVTVVLFFDILILAISMLLSEVALYMLYIICTTHIGLVVAIYATVKYHNP